MAAGPQLRAVTKAVRGMHWLTDADASAVSLAKHYAREIDAAEQSGDLALYQKMLGWYGPYLTGLLKQLGGTPEGRKNLAIEAKQAKGRLAELRAIRDGSRSA